MTTGVKQASNVAIASLPVDTDRGTIHVQDAQIDTGGSRKLASRHLLKDIRLAKSYGNEPIRMVTVKGLSPDYNHQGELHTTDENGIPLVILCYVQEQPIMGHDTFILLSNNTIVDSNIDINQHAKTSKEIGAVPLKRLKSSPYHHMDTYSANQTTDDSIPLNDIAFDVTHLAMHAAFDAKARHLQQTGKRLRRSTKVRRKRFKARTTESWLSSEWDSAFMSEIALQGLLDRTKADEQDEEDHVCDRHKRHAHEQVRYSSTQGSTKSPSQDAQRSRGVQQEFRGRKQHVPYQKWITSNTNSI
jgi:hypothetical protein